MEIATASAAVGKAFSSRIINSEGSTLPDNCFQWLSKNKLSGIRKTSNIGHTETLEVSLWHKDSGVEVRLSATHQIDSRSLEFIYQLIRPFIVLAEKHHLQKACRSL